MARRSASWGLPGCLVALLACGCVAAVSSETRREAFDIEPANALMPTSSYGQGLDAQGRSLLQVYSPSPAPASGSSGSGGGGCGNDDNFAAASIAPAALSIAQVAASTAIAAVAEAVIATAKLASANAGVSLDAWYSDKQQVDLQQGNGVTFTWTGGAYYPSNGAPTRKLLEDAFQRGSLTMSAPGRHLSQAIPKTGFIATFSLVTSDDIANMLVNSFGQLYVGGYLTQQAATNGAGSYTPYPVTFTDGSPTYCLVGSGPCPTSPDPGGITLLPVSTCSADSDCGGAQGCVVCEGAPTPKCIWPVGNPTCTNSAGAESTCFQGQCTGVSDSVVTYQVDSLVTNDKPCGTFWKQSRPRGSKPPNASIRMGLRQVSDSVAADMQLVAVKDGGSYEVKEMSNLCTNPPTTARGANKTKKRMRTTIKPAIPTTRNLEYLQRLRNKYEAGDLKDAALAWGAGDWAPAPLTYSNGFEPVCIPGELTGCSGGWRPAKAKKL